MSSISTVQMKNDVYPVSDSRVSFLSKTASAISKFAKLIFETIDKMLRLIFGKADGWRCALLELVVVLALDTILYPSYPVLLGFLGGLIVSGCFQRYYTQPKE